MPTRYTSGVSTRKKGHPFGEFPAPDPFRNVEYFNDFVTYDSHADQLDWTVTETGSATQACSDGDGGLLLVTNASSDNDASFQQIPKEFITPAAGKKIWFTSRVKVSDATQSDFIVGLHVTDTSPLSATDGIYFQKDDGDTNLDFYCQKDSSSGQLANAAIATVADATFMKLDFYFDGYQFLYVYVDDVVKATQNLLGGSTPAVTDYLPDTDLSLGFGIQNGEAVAKTMTIDYVGVAKER